MAYARIAPTYNVVAVVCGAVQVVSCRAYAILPYIYTVCNQLTTYIVYIIPQTPKAVAFPITPKTTFDVGKTMSDVGKIMSDVIQTTSDLFSPFANA